MAIQTEKNGRLNYRLGVDGERQGEDLSSSVVVVVGIGFVVVAFHVVIIVVQVWFRSGSGLAQVWFRSGSGLVQVLVQFWFSFGSGLVQVWFRSGSGLVQVT